jgi:UPF0755 protein
MSFVVLLRFIYVPVVTTNNGLRFILQPHESIRIFTKELAKQNLTDHPRLLKWVLRLSGKSHQLKAGEYYFPKGTTLYGIMSQMIEGRGILYRSFTIIPGWNFRQVKQALLENNQLQHMINHSTDHEIMAYVGSVHKELEGEFFPDTYYFLEGSSDLALLKRAYLLMQTKLNKAWISRSDDLPFTDSYQALIAASLIEREAYLKQERAIIAGVLVNRLKKNMLLQFDPTVIYGMGLNYHGSIHKKDLRSHSLYNTYTHKGLPPTPIAMPSMDSINAALHPVQHEYLYFVAHGDGSHQFSKFLSEHVKAIEAAASFSPPFFNARLIKHYLIRNYHG